MSELLDICPVQFIEGINESEEPTNQRFLVIDHHGIAIPYVPNITYNFSALDIFGSPESPPKLKKHEVKIHTDHDDKPGKVLLAKGDLTAPDDVGAQWLRFELVASVVLLANHRYWLAIYEPLTFTIGYSESGRDITPMANSSGISHWSTSGRPWKYMLRFFGRVLPVAQ